MSNLEPLVQFGPWHYRATLGKLWLAAADESEAITLEPRLQKLLNYFLLHPGQLLSKNQLIADVWPAGEGTDAAVMRAVGALRKELADTTQSPQFISTIPKKGYCWLADVEPLTSSRARRSGAGYRLDTIYSNDDRFAEAGRPRHRNFLLVAVLSLLLSCGIIAYGLTYLTLGAGQTVYTRLEPVSALNGREQLPKWHPQHSFLLYQHQPVDQKNWRWVIQSEQRSSLLYSPYSYNALGKAAWRNDSIFFSAVTDAKCVIYQQQVFPDFGEPDGFMPCERWIRHGLAVVDNVLYWLDLQPGHQAQFQLWRSRDTAQARYTKEAVLSEPIKALQVHRLVRHQQYLYALVQVSFSQTKLIQIQPDDGSWVVLAHYPQVFTELFKDQRQLWLGLPQQPLQKVAASGKPGDSLGPLSADLTDVVFANEQVLAVAGAEPVSDLWQLAVGDTDLSLQRWFASNRSERLAAISEQQTAFVSKRSGHEQIWLARRQQLQQLTQLTEAQQVQQLLWYRQQLLALINNQLFQVDVTTGNLHTLLPHGIKPAQIEVCRQQLYWTEFGEQGWQLYRMASNSVEHLLDDVIDVRCAEDGLVLRRDSSPLLQLWHQEGGLRSLELPGFPVDISQAGLWLTNDQGIAWLDSSRMLLVVWHWHGQLEQFLLPAAQNPTAIYSDKSGRNWLLQQNRQQDSDIVRLLPERAP
ncbi:winged helix-turn-helix domain-containing protein [Alkalimonas mucilaginosa]|uniref:Winged helix-turn-helix domain-containing protein n=1 Tax=Alkalimonas mucilaginosa TaxID=3057676 RepID=A0ABU7JCD4_9GAMM|nr:winged helix-turn-helix domain-containing protein [Alkalimonas sp. MEB004]MEE2023339.1 winged helix-turn-helix domain-containing protein [Alkalimonas sp. MEB004]